VPRHLLFTPRTALDPVLDRQAERAQDQDVEPALLQAMLDRHRRLVEARNPAGEYRPAELVQEGGPESVPLARVEQPLQDTGVRVLVLESDDLEEVHLGTP
jgi:hypothetical protein